jgi:hypothetical protein
MVPVRRIYSPHNLQTLFSNAIPLGITPPLPATLTIPVGYAAGSRTTGGFISSSGITALPFGEFRFAFYFTDATGLHLGWANWESTPTSRTIKQWTYNDEDYLAPGGSIHVVPEPASTLPAIALLAAGAAGIRSWRKRKAA